MDMESCRVLILAGGFCWKVVWVGPLSSNTKEHETVYAKRDFRFTHNIMSEIGLLICEFAFSSGAYLCCKELPRQLSVKSFEFRAKISVWFQ